MLYLKGIFVSSIILIFSLRLAGQGTVFTNGKCCNNRHAKSTTTKKESGRNIFSLKGEDFSSFAVHSLDELLRYLPGIEIQQRGPQGVQSDIVIRGGTFQQVLVIIDGVKLNDPLTGHFNMYLPIQTSEIDRIEILKGSASAIWGSEAVGGVVNIITKTFSGNAKKND